MKCQRLEFSKIEIRISPSCLILGLIMYSFVYIEAQLNSGQKKASACPRDFEGSCLMGGEEDGAAID